MEVGIIEMPAEQTYRAKYEGTTVEGWVEYTEGKNKPWRVIIDGSAKADYYSREAAMCRLLMEHFEKERQLINSRSRAAAKGQHAPSAGEVSE